MDRKKHIERYKYINRPPLYNDSNELLEYFYQYIMNCIDEDRYPTMPGYVVHCFGSRQNKHNYEKKEDFFDAFERIHAIMEDEAIVNPNLDASTKKIYLQTKFNYLDKLTTTNENVNINENLESLSKEERQQRISELLNKMNKQ